MRVNPNSELPGAAQVPARAPVQAPALGQDHLALSQAEGLNRALDQTPAARPEEVARAQSLVQDLSYPPMVLIRKISSLLAIHLQAPDPSQSSV